MATTDTTELTLAEWRVGQFLEMGFEEPLARTLGAARTHEGWPVDVHEVRRLVLAGCPAETVLRIVL